jgi:hypothetical protein
MKMLLMFVLASTFPRIFAFCQGACDRPAKTSSAANKHESPFACDRLAFTSAQRKRHFDELSPQVRAMVKSVRELPSGYEFEFAPDSATIAKLAEWVAGERQCCPFFDFVIRVERERGPVWLRLTGREGTKELIRAALGNWMKQ